MPAITQCRSIGNMVLTFILEPITIEESFSLSLLTGGRDCEARPEFIMLTFSRFKCLQSFWGLVIGRAYKANLANNEIYFVVVWKELATYLLHFTIRFQMVGCVSLML